MTWQFRSVGPERRKRQKCASERDDAHIGAAWPWDTRLLGGAAVGSIVKDRVETKHYAPAALSGGKMASRNSDVIDVAEDFPRNQIIYSRIVSAASRG